MKRLYETAETLVYDPVPENRLATRASLHAIGFRKVETAPDLHDLQTRMRNRAPDLLLAEITGSETETCAALQAIRQGELGNNPFVIILATTWRRDGTIVKQVLNSGADDLVVRPISTVALGDRIKALAERRKPFVVTADYIGPDRRREPRAGNTAQCVQVPNSLQLRMSESLAEQLIEREIADAVQRGKETLNGHKLRRNAVQICVQWRTLEQRPPTARDFREVLPRIEHLALELKQLAEGSVYTAALQWCDTIAQSAQSLLALAKGVEGDLEGAAYRPALDRLGQTTLRLGQMLAPEEMEPARMVDLDRIAAGLRPAAA